ncbi:hypothetical protein D3C78_1556070 [compost metagenome]
MERATCWEKVLAAVLMNWCALTIEGISAAGAISQPRRSPVRALLLERLLATSVCG